MKLFSLPLSVSVLPSVLDGFSNGLGQAEGGALVSDPCLELMLINSCSSASGAISTVNFPWLSRVKEGEGRVLPGGSYKEWTGAQLHHRGPFELI